MKHYKDSHNNIYAYESDGSQDHIIPNNYTRITEDEVKQIRDAAFAAGQALQTYSQKREMEYPSIKEQLDTQHKRLKYEFEKKTFQITFAEKVLEKIEKMKNKQLPNISASKKLRPSDIHRIVQHTETSIFDEDKCCKWKGYVTNQKNKKKVDNLFRLKCAVRSLISNAIHRNGYKKTSNSNNIIGCSYDELKEHLESKFEKNKFIAIQLTNNDYGIKLTTLNSKLRAN